jgi:SAM-dependent methyltransferase
VARVTLATAASNASSVAADGRVIPLTLRTYWRAAASISSSVAGGSRPLRVVMLRHMPTMVGHGRDDGKAPRGRAVGQTGWMPTPFDYERDPERFRLASRVTREHLTGTASLYERIAELLAEAGAGRVLDVGCGEGALREALPARPRPWLVGLDASRTMLAAHPPPVVQADAGALPFASGAFDAAVAVNVLDHLAAPAPALGEAHRVLAAGGLLVAATASRHDSPELAGVWRPPPSSFDAEDGPGLVAAVFGPVEVERWDAPMVRLPDRAAVRDYLVARFVPPARAAQAATRVTTPLTLTKRGALIRARRSGDVPAVAFSGS